MIWGSMPHKTSSEPLGKGSGYGLGPLPYLGVVRLMDKILHDPKDPKLWELWYIPYHGQCRILSINSMSV